MCGEGRLWARFYRKCITGVNQRGRNALEAQGECKGVELTTHFILYGINLSITVILL